MKIRPKRFLLGTVAVMAVMIFRLIEISLDEHRVALTHDVAPYIIVMIILNVCYLVLEEND